MIGSDVSTSEERLKKLAEALSDDDLAEVRDLTELLLKEPEAITDEELQRIRKGVGGTSRRSQPTERAMDT